MRGSRSSAIGKEPRGRSSDFPGRRSRIARVTAAGLCRTLTGFPDSPVGLATSGHLGAVAVTIASRSVPPDLSPLDGPPHASERGAAPRRVDVVGIGADGWSSLAEASRALVAEASVVLGSARQLALLPAVEGQRRRPWGRPFGASLPLTLAAHADDEVVVLA